MMSLKIYSVSDRYIKFLRDDPRLKNVFDNKEGARSHSRKYLGVALSINDYNYFIPFSSPKDSAYFVDKDGVRKIRKNIIPIIRMTTTDAVSGEIELKGTLKISNMIPVPQSELTPYNISEESDSNYRILVQKEYEYIRENTQLILKSSTVLYRQKTNRKNLYAEQKEPGYLNQVVDFLYAEQRCDEFIQITQECEYSEQEEEGFVLHM